MSLTFSRVSYSLIAQIFLGSSFIFPSSRMNPRKDTFLTLNRHFSSFNQESTLARALRTYSICSLYSSSILEQISILSRQQMTVFPKYSLRIVLFYLQQVVGALVSLNSITRYLQNPPSTTKAVIYLCPSLIQIKLKALSQSNLVKIFTFSKQSLRVEAFSKGY